MDRSVGAVWVFAHYEWRISELAVRDPCFDRGIFLRVDVAADGIHICVGASARSGGRLVALFVSNRLGKAEV
jgi:hypothetical protein